MRGMFGTIVFGLTVVMIGVHVGEWVLLGRLMSAPTLSGQGTRGQPAQGSAVTRVLGLMNLLRFEAVYYVVLLGFWWLNREAVPAWAVLSLGAAHIGGWAALERILRLRPPAAGFAQDLRSALPRSEKPLPKVEGAGRRMRKVLGGIAVFDVVEVVILGYLAWRLGPG